MNKDRFQRPKPFYPRDCPIKDPRNETRVVDIQPGHGIEEIRCDISVQSLTGAPSDYDALSYVWGDWCQKGTICLNGTPNYPVTRNLWKALRRLRDRHRPRRLWIDQICLDQRGDTQSQREVKQIQIKQIGRIFAQANRVILWFGDADEHIDSLGADAEIKVHKALQHAIRNKSVDPWWTRAWVIEEFALAKKDPLVMFGPYQLEWRKLFDLAEKKNIVPQDKWAQFTIRLSHFASLKDGNFDRNLHSLSMVLKETDTLNPRDKVCCIMPSLPETEKEWIRSSYGNTVSEVFAQATYASIASTGSLGILSLVPRLSSERNYDTPTWAVDFTFPEKNHTIRIPGLPETGLRTKIHDAGYKPFQMMQSYGLYALFNFASGQRSWCRRNPQKTAKPVFGSSNHRKLALTGLEFDCVQDVVGVDASPSLRTIRPDITVIEAWISILAPTSTNRLVTWIDSKIFDSQEREILLSLKKRLASGNPYRQVSASEKKNMHPLLPPAHKQPSVRFNMISALFRAWDKAARPQNASKILELSVPVMLQTMLHSKTSEWMEELQKYDDDAGPIPAFLQNVLQAMKSEASEEPLWIDDEDWFEHVRVCLFKFYMQLDTRGLSFFVTATGFIGLGPADLRADDKVVLCYGSRYPVVLRRSPNGNWLFVGFCYVRGIMDQELWDCFHDINLKETKFVLE